MMSEDHICACDGSCVTAIEELKTLKSLLPEIRILLETSFYHPAGCNAWILTGKEMSPRFDSWNCDCAINGMVHKIEMVEV